MCFHAGPSVAAAVYVACIPIAMAMIRHILSHGHQWGSIRVRWSTISTYWHSSMWTARRHDDNMHDCGDAHSYKRSHIKLRVNPKLAGNYPSYPVKNPFYQFQKKMGDGVMGNCRPSCFQYSSVDTCIDGASALFNFNLCPDFHGVITTNDGTSSTCTIIIVHDRTV